MPPPQTTPALSPHSCSQPPSALGSPHYWRGPRPRPPLLPSCRVSLTVIRFSAAGKVTLWTCNSQWGPLQNLTTAYRTGEFSTALRIWTVGHLPPHPADPNHPGTLPPPRLCPALILLFVWGFLSPLPGTILLILLDQVNHPWPFLALQALINHFPLRPHNTQLTLLFFQSNHTL